MRTLLVEDNPGDVLLIREMLRDHPAFSLECATTLALATEQMSRGDVEVVLLDLGLPDSQGLDTLTRFQAGMPDAPVVVLTGYDDDATAAQAVRQGAQDYLVKGSINAELLRRTLRHAIERKWHERTARAVENERQQQVERAAEVLGRAKADLEKAQRVANVGSWAWHVQTGELDWSDQMFRIFGLSRESFSGSIHDVIAAAIHRDDRERVEASNRSVVEERQPAPLEYRVIHPDGTRRVVWAEAGELELDEHGHAAILRGIVQDITERKLAEAEILALNQELEERVARRTADLAAANQELEAFCYSVSHDLRAPLRAIDGFSRAALEDGGDQLPGAVCGHLERVCAAARRMAELIDALLSLSRLSRFELRRGQVDLGAVAGDVIGALREADPSRAVEFMIGAGLNAEADPRLTRALLENLLGNAWKFTRERERARIEIGRVEQDRETAFFVRDNGVGFDMAYADNLFGAFQRLHDQRRFEGSGIGLATVSRIVRRHGGRVWAEGEVDHGATFYFTLGETGRDHPAPRPRSRTGP